jgi:hypothetical protein
MHLKRFARYMVFAAVAAVVTPAAAVGQENVQATRDVLSKVFERNARDWSPPPSQRRVEGRHWSDHGPVTESVSELIGFIAEGLKATPTRLDSVTTCPPDYRHISFCKLDPAVKVLFALSPVSFAGDRATVTLYSFQHNSRIPDAVKHGKIIYTLQKSGSEWEIVDRRGQSGGVGVITVPPP